MMYMFGFEFSLHFISLFQCVLFRFMYIVEQKDFRIFFKVSKASFTRL